VLCLEKYVIITEYKKMVQKRIKSVKDYLPTNSVADFLRGKLSSEASRLLPSDGNTFL
jgi:hypothetical protein